MLVNERIENTVCASRIRTTDYTPPDPKRLITALRQIGYSFEQALSDLIDNSINSGASKVLIRFICDGNRIRSLVIADNGGGMTWAALRNAMKFGSDREVDPHSLGKYGMGLKLASLSHTRTLTVFTRSNGRSSGRRWTLDGIGGGWNCDVVESRHARKTLDSPWADLELSGSGTLVIWDDIDRLALSSAGLRATLRLLQRRLQTHFGLCFHRFLEKGQLQIFMDQQQIGLPEHGINVRVNALNPFAYDRLVHHEYPKRFNIEINNVGLLTAEAHIWPPNSTQPEYSLGGRAALRQGFYFYRNDRLIQAGGWNGLVDNESEPHSSLARILIDLPAEYDSEFGLNVQKSGVVVPPAYPAAALAATSSDGTTFEEYRHYAHVIYRKHDERAVKEIPLLPVNGIPEAAAEYAANALAPGHSSFRDVSFNWGDLNHDGFFDFDRSTRTITLNRKYRKGIQKQHRGGNADLPLVKTMLFLLVQDFLDSDRVSLKRRKKISCINSLLGEVAAMQKG